MPAERAKINMLILDRNKKIFGLRGQNFIEFAVIAACVAAAFLGMQIYIKRSMMGKMRQSADEIGGQYSSWRTAANTTVSVTSNSTNTPALNQLKDGVGNPIIDSYGLPVYGISSSTDSNETTARTHTESVGPYEAALFNN